MKKFLFLSVMTGCAVLCLLCAAANINPVYTHIRFLKTNDWTDRNVVNHTGDFILKKSIPLEMVQYEKYTFCIRAQLLNNGQMENVLLIVDTGSPANVLSSRVYNEFGNVRDSGFKFRENYIFSPAAGAAHGKGCSFDSLETDSFAVHNILFQVSRHKNFGCTVDGENVDGFIGMDVLRKCPFKYSVANRELLFYNAADNNPAGTKIFFEKKGLKRNRLVAKFVLPDGKMVKGYMDTGAQETYLCQSVFIRLRRHLSHNLDFILPMNHFLTAVLLQVVQYAIYLFTVPLEIHLTAG